MYYVIHRAIHYNDAAFAIISRGFTNITDARQECSNKMQGPDGQGQWDVLFIPLAGDFGSR